jgi:uncharacterized protein
MGVIDGRTWLEHIGPAECWSLLASTPVGRIGVLNDSAPEIYPVNHVVDRDTIIFRTDPGSKPRGLLRSPAVCYQVDGIDPADATGWSVLVKGRVAELHNPTTCVASQTCRCATGPSATRPTGSGIVPDEITGRRIWSRVAPGDGAATGSEPETPTPHDERDKGVHHDPGPDEQ